MKIALIQMPVVADKKANLQQAVSRIRDAACQNIDMAILPEMFCSPYENDQFWHFSEPHGGEVQQVLSALAKELSVYIVAGSLPEAEGEKLYNTSFVYDRAGVEIACHRKAHLFDIDVEGGQRFQESATLSAGEKVTVFDTEFGKLGLCVCFDLRFQELAMTMGQAGAQAILCPAAFNMTTGPAHWELLFRSRAVDNQLYTIGVAPARDETANYVSYGNSIAVDPWGTVLCRGGGAAETLVVTLEFEKCSQIRQQLPILSARQTKLYKF